MSRPLRALPETLVRRTRCRNSNPAESSGLSAVVLAGGASRRMGRDKAWVEAEGTPLIRLAVQKLRELGCVEVFISGRAGTDYSELQCPVLHDLEPGFGPVAGIERGLHACASPHLLVLAVDLPQMTVAFLRKLQHRCHAFTGVVPRLSGQYEPLAAIYPKRCHVLALQAIAHSHRAARDFAEACLREHAVRTLPVGSEDVFCFRNWNEPADLEKAGVARPLRAPAASQETPMA